MFTSVWRQDSTNSTLVIVVSPVQVQQTVSFMLDLTTYEYPEAYSQQFTVYTYTATGERVLMETLFDGILSIDQFLQPRSVLLFEIVPRV